MKKNWQITIVLLVTVALPYGCSSGNPEVKYRILSFFFDGVPPPAGTGPEGSAVGRKEDRKKDEPKKDIFMAHGPYAARLCNGCHIRGSNKLLMPIKELCFMCHTLDVSKKYVHGPLAAGGCAVCHAPHGSNYAFYLVSESRDFCFYCHDKKAVFASNVHQGVSEECTVCHDAHSSDTEYLLKVSKKGS
jgi:predicted CXXCH cytochrome family protein